MEDLSDFFDDEDFAKDASYIEQGQSPKIIKVIYDRSYFEVDQGQVGIDSYQASVEVKDSDIPNIKQDDSFLINELTFLVKGIHPDGTGLTTLILERTS